MHLEEASFASQMIPGDSDQKTIASWSLVNHRRAEIYILKTPTSLINAIQ
jgi:hypothetical protein